MTLAMRVIPGAITLLWMAGCIGYSDSSDGGGELASVQGVSQNVKAKLPKYQLFCASNIADLKTPASIQLVANLDSVDATGDIALGSTPVPKDKYCMLNVVATNPSEAGIQWTAKGADGQALSGVFYRSNAQKVVDGKLSLKLYQTHIESGKETVDAFVTATFPTGSSLSTLSDASLTCNSTTIKALAHEITSATSKVILTFPLPKDSFKDRTSTCDLTTTIDGVTYKGKGLSVTPKSTDNSVTLETSLTKDVASSDPTST